MPERNLLAVLWDMDGTLIDTEPVWIRAKQELIRQHGGTWHDSIGEQLIGASMDAATSALRQAGVQLEEEQIASFLIAAVIAELEAGAPWRPGALRLVSELARANVAQAIVTTSPRAMADIVIRELPENLISVVVAFEDVEFTKPHPQPYLLAAELLGVHPAECVAIEDSPTGLAAAISAGTTAVGVPNQVPLNDPGAWFRYESLTEVEVSELRRLVIGDRFDR